MNNQFNGGRPRGLLEVVPVPRLPIESIRFVATVMDSVSQRTQLGGCAQEAEDGSSSVLIARDRSVEVVTPRLKVVNETSGTKKS